MADNAGDIDVDLHGLRAFADALHHDVDAGLIPGIERAYREIRHEIAFGAAVPGGQLAACRQVMAAALQRAHENAASKVIAARLMAEAIEAMLAGYEDADDLSMVRLAAVTHRDD